MDIDEMNFFQNQRKPALEEPGVIDLLTDDDRHLIKVKNRLMRLAINPRTKFDFNQHKGSDNLGIVNFCRFCNIDPEEFIRSYIRNLQPFMIHLVNNRCDNLTNFVCMLDASYSLPLWIEVTTTQFNEEVISFHEMNWRNPDIAKYYKMKTYSLCQLKRLQDFMPQIGTDTNFEVEVVRGFSTFTLNVWGKLVARDYIRVDTNSLMSAMLIATNGLLSDITNKFNSSGVPFPQFTGVNQLSFTSYGDNISNDVSLLIDLIYTRKDSTSAILGSLSLALQELFRLPNHEIIIEYLIDKFKTYHGIDISGLLVTGDMGYNELEDINYV